jgi:TP901 family phage tail tape measure protein
MAGNYTRRINLYINGKQVRNDIKSINAEFLRLSRTIRTMTIGSREYNRTMAQIRNLRGIIDQHNAQLRVTQINLTSLKGLANALNKYWPVIMGTIGAITGLVMGTRRATDEFQKFDDKIADVMKVTDMTRQEVIELNKEMMKINTRTAQNDLLDLAYVAGKLGVRGQQDLLGFANAADKISVALSKELGGNAEDAIRAIGKSVEIFSLDKVYGIEEAMLRVGSAVNALGMASTAQEGFLINFVERTAGIAPLAGVSIDKILGLAAALDRFGQKSEVSATAYSKLMSKMATETESMAKIMGMSIEDYLTAFTNDANETMLQLFETLKGAGEGNASFAQLVKLLGETDLEGQRMTQVMGTMVNKVNEIREQMNLAGKAMEENTSIMKEFTIKNETGAAKVEKKQKSIQALRVELGEKLFPVYMHGLSVQEQFMKSTGAIIGFVYKHRSAIAALITYILVYRTALKTIVALQKLQIITSGYLQAALLRVKVAYFAMTGSIYKAAKAKIALRAITLTNPWILLAAAIMAVVAAVSIYRMRISDAIKEAMSLNEEYNRIHADRSRAVQQERSELEELFNMINATNEGGALRNKLVGDLIQKYPELLAGLNKEKLMYNDIFQIMQALNREYHTRLKIIALEAKSEAYKQKIIDNNVRIIEIEQYLADMRANPQTQMNTALIKSLESEYNHLEGLNKNYIKQMEELAKKAKDTRTDSIKEEIELQKKSLADYQFALKHVTDEVMKEKLLNRILTTETIITNLEKQLINATTGFTNEGGVSGTKDKYSDEAEMNARINAKRRYQKGLIKTEEDLNNKLDQISLSFMRGRLKQMDKDAEDRTELMEKIVDKELEIQRDKQKRLDEINAAGIELSPVQKAELDFNDQLKKLNIFHKQKKDLSEAEALAYETLKQKHQLAIDKIDADAIKKNIDDKQLAFDTTLAAMKLEHIKELDLITTYEEGMAHLKKTYSDEELKDIKTLNQARLKIQKDQQIKETDLTIQHLETLLTEMQSFKDGGALEGLSLADGIISQEEFDTTMELINEIIEKLRQLKKERKEATGEDDEKEHDIKMKGKFKTDILGFTTDDWKTLFDNLKKGEDMVESIAMAAYALSNAWADTNAIIKNKEDKALTEYEKRINYRKKLLDDQLEKGIISQDLYNKKTDELDSKLDNQKAIYARKQAIRDRNVAMFQAIINMAAAIAEANPNIALMALAAAAGALQIGIIASTPLPQLPGKEEGGFFDVFRAQDKKKFKASYQPDKRGWIDKPTILAGEKPGSREYVIPDEAMDNPSIAPLIQMLEMARISHNLKTVDLSAAIPSLPGRVNGGFFYQDSGAGSAKPSNTKPISPRETEIPNYRELTAALTTLNQILKSGNIRAKLVYQDYEDMTEKVDTIEKDSSF